MKKKISFYQNIPFAFSSGAYFFLAIPASEKGLAFGALLTVICLFAGFFLPNIWQFTKLHAAKGHWIASGMVCLLMGLRFDNVWKLSGQISALTTWLKVDRIVFLTVIGCFLALMAVYFTTVALIGLLKCPMYLVKDRSSMADSQRISRTLIVGTIALLAVQLALLCCWGVQKQSYHVDEVYTFELSNYPETVYGDAKDSYASWKSGDTFAAVLEPADSRLFDLSVPFYNGETDNHPSTYYILVNIFSSMFKLLEIKVNKWAGLIPNFVCCLVTTVFFVLLLRNLLKNDIVALLGGTAWAFCIGAINIGVYLRMYALLTMATMIFCWLHAKLLSEHANGHNVKRTLLLLQLVTIGGILSQYYFLFLAFFFCGLICMYFFAKREWSMLRCYMVTEICAVFVAELLFPRMLVRLLFGDRGTEALDNMMHGSGYGVQLRNVLDIISQELFGGYGFLVLVVSTILLLITMAVCWHKEKHLHFSDGFALLVMTAVFGYILIVTKIAPYQVDRYYMCVFPLLILYSFYGICRGVLVFTRNNRICAEIIAVVLMFTGLVCTAFGEVSYIYPDGNERIEKLLPYKNLPVVALNGDHYDDSVLQWAFEFRNFDNVFLCRNNQMSDIAIAAENGMLDGGFLLYIHYDTSDERPLFEQLSQWIAIEEYNEITDIQKCRVYYCTTPQK